MKTISVSELHSWLTDAERLEKPLLLDVREPWEAQIAQITGSKLVPLSAFMNHLSSLSPERDMVCICHHGMRSAQVAIYLERQGFAKVVNLTGGIDAWAANIDPTMARY